MTPTRSHLQCDELPALGGEVVGRKSIQVLVLGIHYIRLTSLTENPWVTMLPPMTFGYIVML